MQQPPIQSPYYIAVGRLTPQKDFPTLLRAYAEARKRGTPEHLFIAGDGELRAELEQLARDLNIADSAHFLGHVSNPYPLIKNARALILSSIFEGFAYVPLEAMALGVPVISTDCPSGPSDILGDGKYGILVPPANPSALADAMHRLSSTPSERARLSEQSCIRSEELTVQSMAQQYRDLFLEHAASLSSRK
jgi:glycosyltransferase involved in cell wall biosynthesis